jgi:hypothetical protein
LFGSERAQAVDVLAAVGWYGATIQAQQGCQMRNAPQPAGSTIDAPAQHSRGTAGGISRLADAAGFGRQ